MTRAYLTSFLILAPLVWELPQDNQVRPGVRELCRLDANGRSSGVAADVCAQVAARWQILAGTAALPGAVFAVDSGRIRSSAGPTGWALRWPAPQTRTRSTQVRPDGYTAYEALNILTHEAGHNLFASVAAFPPTVTPGGRYGSVAPDWFDEAPATWMESPEMRASRVRPIRGTKPSLVTLVTMTHPVHESRNVGPRDSGFTLRQRTVTPPCPQCSFFPDSVRGKYRVTDIGLDANGRGDTIVWYSEANPSKQSTLEEREFYGLAYSLLDFIHQRGGSAAVNLLLSRYRADPRPRAEALAGLPGLPATVAEVEIGWHQFLAR